MRSSADAPSVKIGLDDPGGTGKVRISTDGPGQPIDIGRFERGDLAQRVIVELSEGDDHRGGFADGRGGRPAESTESAADERAGRGRCPRRLASHDISSTRRLAGQRRSCSTARDRPVAFSEGMARVDPAGHRRRRLRLRRTTLSARDARFEWCLVLAASRSSTRVATATCQVGVRVVDLGHPTSRQPRRRRIVAGQVRMIGASESAPGCLDLGRRGTRLHAQHISRISSCHHRRVYWPGDGSAT